MRRRTHIFLTIVAAFAIIGFSGCALSPIVDSTRFYLLDAENYAPVSSGENREIVVGMHRVQLARYLDPPEITIREGKNRIIYLNNDRWAEPLEFGVARVLSEALRKEPAIAHVDAGLGNSRPFPDFDLYVSVLQAEGVVVGNISHAEFQAIWELRTDRDQIAAKGRFDDDSLPWDGQNIEDLTAALSDAMARLSQQIALEIERL